MEKFIFKLCFCLSFHAFILSAMGSIVPKKTTQLETDNGQVIQPENRLCSRIARKENRTACGPTDINISACSQLNCCWDSMENGTKCFQEDSFLHNIEDMPLQDQGFQRKASNVQRLIFKARKVIEGLQTLKKRILKARTDYNIAKTVGASASIAGICAIIGGVFAAPFTGGLSLGLTIGGIAGTVGGGATTLTTVIIEHSKTNQWADDLMGPLAALEIEWNRTISALIVQPEWSQVTATSFPALFLAAPLVYMGDALSSAALAASFANAGVSGTAAVTAAAPAAQAVVEIGSTVYTTTATTVVSIGGTVLGAVGLGLNVYTIVNAWANDPELATQIDEIVSKWTHIISNLENFCRIHPNACEKVKENICKRALEKFNSIESAERHRNKRETHQNMARRTCENVNEEWIRRYEHVDSRILSAGDNSPIQYVGYKDMMNPNVPERIWQVVTHVAGVVQWQHLGRPRENFGDDWNRRMRLLGRWPRDVKGHVVADQLGGPIAWYNLVPMTRRLNGNIGNPGGQGMTNVENLMRYFVEEECGEVNFDTYLNYEFDLSGRPYGIKICLQVILDPVLNPVIPVRRMDYYFRNDIP